MLRVQDIENFVPPFFWRLKLLAQKTPVREGSETISLEELRRVFSLESIEDPEGNVIREAPLPVWANFQQRAIDVAILEINTKTDLKIKLAATERSKHRRVVALKFRSKPKRYRKEQFADCRFNS